MFNENSDKMNKCRINVIWFSSTIKSNQEIQKYFFASVIACKSNRSNPDPIWLNLPSNTNNNKKNRNKKMQYYILSERSIVGCLLHDHNCEFLFYEISSFYNFFFLFLSFNSSHDVSNDTLFDIFRLFAIVWV